jgi:subtilisin family serine protease
MKIARSVTVILILLIVSSLMSIGQVNVRTLGRSDYAQFNGVWYTLLKGEQGDLVDTNHLVVRLKDQREIETVNFEEIGVSPLRDVRGRFAGGFYELEIPKGSDAFETAFTLFQSREFEQVLFNVFMRVDAIPNDPQFGDQWNLPRTIVPFSWDITTGDPGTIVAVIDVGGDYNHEDLAGNRWAGTGYDFYDNDPDPFPSDGAGHGTAVAGILGAVTNNGIGISGLGGGWAGVGGIRIMHLDAGYRDAFGYEWIGLSAAAQATDYAATNGAKVINMSFGGDPYLPLETAINNAVNNNGVVVVASAGNYHSGEPTAVVYPAAYDNVIAVGATTESDARKTLNDGSGEDYWGSCYGPELDVVAPGIHARTTDITGSPRLSHS